jgi:O-antigen/teichoic acid export membrane protein
MAPPKLDPIWGDTRPLAQIARNLVTRYLMIFVDTIIGLFMLPFNVAHLGKEAYGLWLLTASITAYFSLLDLGYGGAHTKFVAQYRAWRDANAINEITSTLFAVFASVGLICYGVAAALAFNLDHLFALTPEQAYTGRAVLLIVAVQFSLSFAFAVYGGIVNGFQRYDANNLVAIGSAVLVAIANILVLVNGGDLVTLVAWTTGIRVLALFLYRANAYRIFPALRVRLSLVRRARFREITGFSVYSLIIDWANKLNYSIDPLIIAGFLGAGPVAIWGVAQRIVWAVQRVTNQLNSVLFPAVVDSDARERPEHLRSILLQGTRLSLATVVPIAACILVVAPELIEAWVGPDFAASAIIVQVLTVVVAVRVGNATAATVLKGAGEHRFLALTNIGTSVVNVALSIALIGPLGLLGNAIGTLIPVTFSAFLLLFPAACRRTNVSLYDGWRFAVWPALWPVLPVTLMLIGLRPYVPASLAAIAAFSAAGALVYVALFITLALGTRERDLYLRKVRQLVLRTEPQAA